MRRGFGLNGAALARLYFRGGLYPMAASELLSLLEKSPDRLDLHEDHLFRILPDQKQPCEWHTQAA